MLLLGHYDINQVGVFTFTRTQEHQSHRQIYIGEPLACQ